MSLTPEGEPSTSDPFEGLISRKEALSGRKKQMPKSDGDGFDEFDVAATEVESGDPAPELPPTAVPAPLPPKITRPRGRPPKRRAAAAAPAPETTVGVGTGNAPGSAQTQFASASAPAVPLPDPDGFDPCDPLIRWPQILDKLRAQGQGPNYVMIRIIRAGEGAFPSPPAQVDLVDGGMFMGDDSMSAGQQLVDYVTNFVHLVRRGPARYKLQTYYKTGKGSEAQMLLRLEDPADIRLQQQKKMEYLTERAKAGNLAAGNPPLGFGYPHSMSPAAPPTTTAAAPPGYFPQPQQQVDPFEWLQRAESYRQQVMETQRLGQPPPPPPQAPAPMAAPLPPPPPPAPRLSEQEIVDLEAGRFARMAKALGYAPTGVGAPPSPTVAAQAAEDPVSAMDRLITTFEKISKVKERLAALGETPGAEEVEPPKEPETPEKKIAFFKVPGIKPFGRDFQIATSSENWVEQIKETLLGNPEFTGDMAIKMIGGVAQVLDKTSFGSLLNKLAAQPGAGQAAAAAVQAAGIVGVGAVNGAPAHKPLPRGPIA
jgi:hypothetical protein